MLCVSPKKGPLLGNFEESILNNRLEPVRIVDGYRAEVRASGHFQPRPLSSTVRVSFYSAGDSFPYLGQIHIGHRGYRIPKKGTLQVTLFNPLGTVVKLFLLLYDLNDMPPNSQTFLRQRTIFVPCGDSHQFATKHHCDTTTTTTTTTTKQANSNTSQPAKLATNCKLQMRGLRYLIQLNIVSSKKGRIYLNKDLRIFISKKVDLETASQLLADKQDYELKSFVEMPKNPRYFAR